VVSIVVAMRTTLHRGADASVTPSRQLHASAMTARDRTVPPTTEPSKGIRTMTITALPTTTRSLPDELLERFRTRAAGYDRANIFFHDDFEELVEIGYLTAPVPEELGGWGLSLAELAEQQRRLARYAPATALATSMHFYWVGMAAELHRSGDTSCDWILHDVVAGHVFAAGHAEAGNDISVALSTARAERVDGGYRFYGHKHFGSLSPVWTRFGVHATDATSDPEHPTIVHGFVDRDDAGFEVIPTWDALGMRATQSHDTKLDGVFVPDERIGAITPVGDTNNPWNFYMLLWALTLISNVYLGIAERAFELAVAATKRKTSIGVARGSMAYHPMIQHRISEMYLELDAMRAVADRVLADWTSGVDHGEVWAMQILSAKWRATEGAKRVVDIAVDVAGGQAMYKTSELERLYRDVRAGGFHPGTVAFTHEIVGKVALGVVADQPRW
jgi:alkylation response protein AidB-like acyl-CoA dehydrogenase